MAKAKTAPKKTARASEKAESAPRFPYTTKPSSLRRLLKDIPTKPRPPKFTQALLRSWGFSDTNDYTMLRVLKAIGLLNGSNEPTELYARFMNLDDGAKALGPELRRVYEPLFQASLKPFDESNEKLQNMFNIYSGGGAKTLELQIQTFKALSENTAFNGVAQSAGNSQVSATIGGLQAAEPSPFGGGAVPPIVNINLHIHLPENKTRREYEDIIEDIGRYIFGREGGRRDR